MSKLKQLGQMQIGLGLAASIIFSAVGGVAGAVVWVQNTTEAAVAPLQAQIDTSNQDISTLKSQMVSANDKLDLIMSYFKITPRN